MPRTQSFDPISRLRRRNQRQKSDVAQKLIAMCLHEVSAVLVRERPFLRVETTEYEAAVRFAFSTQCVFCQLELTSDLHVEHLDAMNRVRAGLHVAGNVVLSCKHCNWAKRNDDQGRGIVDKGSGWEDFLAHTDGACADGCSGCQYWLERFPDESTRTALRSRQRVRIMEFRTQFHIDALRRASLSMVQELERVYRSWQASAEESTSTFSASQLPQLLASLPTSV